MHVLTAPVYRSIRHAVLLVGLMFLLLNLWGLRPVSATSPAQDQEPTSLRVAMPAPTTLDPVQLSRFDPNARDLVENLFIGLTRFDPITHEIEPMLAQSWTVSDDGLTWTFTLREDFQWVRYDPAGQQVVAIRPVAAGDFVYAVQRACDPRRPSPVTANLAIIEGCLTVASAFPEVINDLLVAREIGVRATGPYTLEITLMFPAAYFPSLLSTPEFRPLPREAITAAENWTQVPAIMTNGPYVIQLSQPSGMVLVQNPYWPDELAGNLAQIDVIFSEEVVSLISSDRADVARLSDEQIGLARDLAPDVRLTIDEGTTLTMLGFSPDRRMVELAEIRRALSLAIDREALTQQFFPDLAQPVTQFTSPDVAAAPDLPDALYDPAQAQSYFAAAGFPNCAGVPEKMIVLVPDDDPLWVEMGRWITQQWSTVFGCNPALFEVKPIARTLLIEIAHANYDAEKVTRSHIWLATWNADYPDANAWINDALHCRYGYIRIDRTCDVGDQYLDQATLESDPAQRATLYGLTEEQFFGPNGVFPVTPLFISTTAWLRQSQVTQINSSGAARYDLWVRASNN